MRRFVVDFSKPLIYVERPSNANVNACVCVCVSA